jgi:hypothetical protein
MSDVLSGQDDLIELMRKLNSIFKKSSRITDNELKNLEAEVRSIDLRPEDIRQLRGPQ